MLKTFKIILTFCLLHSLCKGQTYFSNFYKTGYNNGFSTNIIQQADSSHVIFNYVVDSLTGRQDIALLKINKTGTQLLKKVSNIQNLTYLAYLNGLKQFIAATPSSFLATGGTYTGSTTTMIFTKLNRTTLDTIRNTFYDDGINNYYLNTFIKFNDNKYYLIGGKGAGTTQWPVIFHLDSNLTIVNIITLNNPINLTTTNAVLNPLTKKLVLGGTISTNNNQTVGFIEADTLGTISNTSVLPFNQGNGISQLKYSSFDNTYVFSGAKKTSTYGNNSMYRVTLTKVSAAGLTKIWNKTYGSSSVWSNLNGLLINNDGSIVACGRYSDSTSLPLMNYDTKGVIIKAKANGDSVWMRQYNNYIYGSSPTNYQETFFGVERTFDGGYILCGNVMNQPQAKAWIVKTDSNGCVNAGCGYLITGGDEGANALSELTEIISLYPNPTNGTFILKANDNLEFPKQIIIRDVMGRNVKVIDKPAAYEHEFNLEKESPGIYMITVYYTDKLISKRIIKN